MADPQIQSILKDPMVQQCLEDLQGPRAAETMARVNRDPGMAEKINKLIAAGVIGLK